MANANVKKVKTQIRVVGETVYLDFIMGNGDVHSVDVTVSTLDNVEDGTDDGLSMAQRGLCHGITQKVVDSVSNVTDLAKASERIGIMCGRVRDGEWFEERSSEGVNPGILAEALSILKQMPLDVATKKVKAETKERRKTLWNHKPIQELIQEIKARRAKELAERMAPKVAEEAESILEDWDLESE